MGKVIPEDVHAVCVEDAERLREQRDMYRATALALRHDHAHTLETERRLRACLDRIEERCAASGWQELVADAETWDSGYRDGMGTAVAVISEERARAEGKPAEGGK
jgi:hypothetical protein